MANIKVMTALGPLMADSETGALLVQIAPYTTGGIGAKDCTAADTNYTLAAQACRSVMLQAPTTNSGLLWLGIGTAAVEGKGLHLAAGNWVNVGASDLSMVNVLAKSAGDDLCYQWVN